MHVRNVEPAMIEGAKFDGTVDPCRPPAPLPSAQPEPLKLMTLANHFAAPIGIDNYEPDDSLLVTVNYPTGDPYNLESVDRHGRHKQFSSMVGLEEELKVASAPFYYCPGTASPFPVGDAFFGNGVDGQIARVTVQGQTLINPWVDLPGEGNGLFRGFLFIDRTGLYGGDLIVGTTNGEVWRITSEGVPTKIADVDTHLEGGITVPNDARYGPLSGKILAGAEGQGLLYAFNPFAAEDELLYRTYDVRVDIEDIDLIPARGHFYGVDHSGEEGEGGRVLAADADALAWMAGDILLVQEAVPNSGYDPNCPECPPESTSGMFHLYWDAEYQQLKADLMQ